MLMSQQQGIMGLCYVKTRNVAVRQSSSEIEEKLQVSADIDIPDGQRKLYKANDDNSIDT